MASLRLSRYDSAIAIRGCILITRLRVSYPRANSSFRPLGLKRRDFLKLFAGAGTALVIYNRIGPRSAAAAPRQVPTVLAELLRLDPSALAAGELTSLLLTPGGIAPAAAGRGGNYVSPVVQAQKNPFTHVGLHWIADGAESISFQLRWSPDGRSWSEWEDVVIDPH